MDPKLQGVLEEMCTARERERRSESAGVDRGGERHFLWLQAQLVSLPDRRGCQIFIPALETAGGVNTTPASVMPPHKTQPCVCAHSSPTVTTRRYHVATVSTLSPRLLQKKRKQKNVEKLNGLRRIFASFEESREKPNCQNVKQHQQHCNNLFTTRF